MAGNPEQSKAWTPEETGTLFLDLKEKIAEAMCIGTVLSSDLHSFRIMDRNPTLQSDVIDAIVNQCKVCFAGKRDALQRFLGMVTEKLADCRSMHERYRNSRVSRLVTDVKDAFRTLLQSSPRARSNAPAETDRNAVVDIVVLQRLETLLHIADMELSEHEGIEE